MSKLTQKRCQACEGGVPPLSEQQVGNLLKEIPDWTVGADAKGLERVVRRFQFKNYYHTIAFVNAIAWMAHQENHHPDLEVGYNHCTVHYSTHAIQGLSENDFICAAKVDALFA